MRDARDAHRDPNIKHFYAQVTQHNTYRARALYHRKPIKKDARIQIYFYLLVVASETMVGLPVFRVATINQDAKANFYSVGLQEIRSLMDKPPVQFKAYFLTIFSDKDYSKITESLNRVGKSFMTVTQAPCLLSLWKFGPRRTEVPLLTLPPRPSGSGSSSPA